MSRLLFFLLLVTFSASCGRKGPPRPPEAMAPAPVEYLSAKGKVQGIEFTWRAPQKNAKGDELKNLAGFIIERSEYEGDEFGPPLEVAKISADSGLEIMEKDAYNRERTVKEYRFLDLAADEAEAGKKSATGLKAGKKYEYQIIGENEEGVRGKPGFVVRATFVGESSSIEIVPLR